jgi:SpoIID/LytB domain protein
MALVALLLLTAIPASSAAESDDEITFDGAGWGHGVGMSQYGARAMAIDGSSYEDILAHYYTGDASVGTLGVEVTTAPNVWVNLRRDQTAVTFIAVPVGSGDHAPVVVERGAEVWSLTPNQGVTIAQSAGLCTIDILDGNGVVIATSGPGSCDVDLTWDGELEEPTTMVEIDGCVLYDWNPPGANRPCRYRFGAGISLDNPSWNASGPFEVVLEIDIDDYTDGISEMDYRWPAAALEAQAVAARSFGAAAAFKNHQDQSCFCDLYDTSRSQRYVGWGHGGSYAANWDDATATTAGQVIVHPDAPTQDIVSTVYSSSSGGATEAANEKWGGSPKAYLMSVDDRWSLDPFNPFASWAKTVTRASVEAAVGLDEITTIDVTEINTSGSAKTVTFSGLDGGGPGVVKKSSDWVAKTFGLRSWYFDVSFGPGDPGTSSQASSIGLQDPRTGIWYLRDPGGATRQFYFGNPLDIPFIGDWDGDGDETVGLYRRSTGFLFLRNTNTQGVADIDIYYGDPGDLPIAGDWNGDGTDTVGIFRPSDSRFYLRNTNTQGIADVVVDFGNAGDVPLAGDWNSDGIDSIGVYRPSTKTVYLANDIRAPKADVIFEYTGTAAGDDIIAGDWNGDGFDTLGVFRPSEAKFYLRDTYTQSSANIILEYGEPHMNPIAGSWGP